MGKSREYYERNLPHYQPEDYAFFVTFRLYGTLPTEVVENFKAVKKKRLEMIAGFTNTKVRSEKYEEFQWEYFEMYDNYMNKCSIGYQWLKQKEVADIVKEAMHYRDGKEYDLIAYTIMPNHVHMVFIPIVKRFAESLTGDLSESGDSLYIRVTNTEQNSMSRCSTGRSLFRITKILENLKKYTAGKCNKVLRRKGAFWQHESYDHVIRDSNELKRIVDYVLNNPVRARLADTPEEWGYNYVNYNLIPVL